MSRRTFAPFASRVPRAPRAARVAFAAAALVAVILPLTQPAFAQGPPEVDGGTSAAPSASAAAAPAPVPSPISAPSAPSEGRPVRGPALRERAGRRSRGASTASGALMLTILIGFFAWYVIKRIRR